MGRRIDLGDDDSDDSLKDAMRQLERQLGKQKEAAPEEPGEAEGEAAPTEDEAEAKRRFEEERRAGHRRSREDIQDALEAIGREQRAAAARRPRRAAAWVVWVVLGVVVVGGIVAAAVRLRPEPLPPTAVTPEQAVEGFWRALIDGKYEAATVYYPGLVERYASRKQAALHLRDQFGQNPPIEITGLGEAEEIPDSGDLRVSYEVCLRNGWPRPGEFIVRRAAGAEAGYVIVATD
jgi:hypothetical protein